MKTIFISILSGVEAKSILRTNILKTLLEPKDVQVVLFVKSAERVAFYEREFKDPRILYQVVTEYPFSKWNSFFDTLKHYLVRNKTQSLYKYLKYKDTKNLQVFVLSHSLNILLGWSMPRAIVRFFDLHFHSDTIFT